jgi:hypothetical protein
MTGKTRPRKMEATVSPYSIPKEYPGMKSYITPRSCPKKARSRVQRATRVPTE